MDVKGKPAPQSPSGLTGIFQLPKELGEIIVQKIGLRNARRFALASSMTWEWCKPTLFNAQLNRQCDRLKSGLTSKNRHFSTQVDAPFALFDPVLTRYQSFRPHLHPDDDARVLVRVGRISRYLPEGSKKSEKQKLILDHGIESRIDDRVLVALGRYPLLNCANRYVDKQRASSALAKLGADRAVGVPLVWAAQALKKSNGSAQQWCDLLDEWSASKNVPDWVFPEMLGQGVTVAWNPAFAEKILALINQSDKQFALLEAYVGLLGRAKYTSFGTQEIKATCTHLFGASGKLGDEKAAAVLLAFCARFLTALCRFRRDAGLEVIFDLMRELDRFADELQPKVAAALLEVFSLGNTLEWVIEHRDGATDQVFQLLCLFTNQQTPQPAALVGALLVAGKLNRDSRGPARAMLWPLIEQIPPGPEVWSAICQQLDALDVATKHDYLSHLLKWPSGTEKCVRNEHLEKLIAASMAGDAGPKRIARMMDLMRYLPQRAMPGLKAQLSKAMGPWEFDQELVIWELFELAGQLLSRSKSSKFQSSQEDWARKAYTVFEAVAGSIPSLSSDKSQVSLFDHLFEVASNAAPTQVAQLLCHLARAAYAGGKGAYMRVFDLSINLEKSLQPVLVGVLARNVLVHSKAGEADRHIKLMLPSAKDPNDPSLKEVLMAMIPKAKMRYRTPFWLELTRIVLKAAAGLAPESKIVLLKKILRNWIIPHQEVRGQVKLEAMREKIFARLLKAVDKLSVKEVSEELRYGLLEMLAMTIDANFSYRQRPLVLKMLSGASGLSEKQHEDLKRLLD
jgi:hypothetical protein